MAKKHDVVWEPGGRIGHIVEETKTMTPDERLREAVGKPNSLRDWTIDFGDENGNYQNLCVACGEIFIGHKRRIRCRACAENSSPCINAAVKVERKPWWRFW